MAIAEFGVTATVIAEEYDVQHSYGATSKPTSTNLAKVITTIAARVNSILVAKGFTPAGITDAAYPASYRWLRDLIALGVMARLQPVTFPQVANGPAARSQFVKDFEAGLKDLRARPQEVLSDVWDATEGTDTFKSSFLNPETDVTDASSNLYDFPYSADPDVVDV